MGDLDSSGLLEETETPLVAREDLFAEPDGINLDDLDDEVVSEDELVSVSEDGALNLDSEVGSEGGDLEEMDFSTVRLQGRLATLEVSQMELSNAMMSYSFSGEEDVTSLQQALNSFSVPTTVEEVDVAESELEEIKQAFLVMKGDVVESESIVQEEAAVPSGPSLQERLTALGAARDLLEREMLAYVESTGLNAGSAQADLVAFSRLAPMTIEEVEVAENTLAQIRNDFLALQGLSTLEPDAVMLQEQWGVLELSKMNLESEMLSYSLNGPGDVSSVRQALSDFDQRPSPTTVEELEAAEVALELIRQDFLVVQETKEAPSDDQPDVVAGDDVSAAVQRVENGPQTIDRNEVSSANDLVFIDSVLGKSPAIEFIKYEEDGRGLSERLRSYQSASSEVMSVSGEVLSQINAGLSTDEVNLLILNANNEFMMKHQVMGKVFKEVVGDAETEVLHSASQGPTEVRAELERQRDLVKAEIDAVESGVLAWVADGTGRDHESLAGWPELMQTRDEVLGVEATIRELLEGMPLESLQEEVGEKFQLLESLPPRIREAQINLEASMLYDPNTDSAKIIQQLIDHRERLLSDITAVEDGISSWVDEGEDRRSTMLKGWADLQGLKGEVLTVNSAISDLEMGEPVAAVQMKIMQAFQLIKELPVRIEYAQSTLGAATTLASEILALLDQGREVARAIEQSVLDWSNEDPHNRAPSDLYGWKVFVDTGYVLLDIREDSDDKKLAWGPQTIEFIRQQQAIIVKKGEDMRAEMDGLISSGEVLDELRVAVSQGLASVTEIEGLVADREEEGAAVGGLGDLAGWDALISAKEELSQIQNSLETEMSVAEIQRQLSLVQEIQAKITEAEDAIRADMAERDGLDPSELQKDQSEELLRLTEQAGEMMRQALEFVSDWVNADSDGLRDEEDLSGWEPLKALESDLEMILEALEDDLGLEELQRQLVVAKELLPKIQAVSDQIRSELAALTLADPNADPHELADQLQRAKDESMVYVEKIRVLLEERVDVSMDAFKEKSEFGRVESYLVLADDKILALRVGDSIDSSDLEIIFELKELAMDDHAKLLEMHQERDDFLGKIQQEKDRAMDYISKIEETLDEWENAGNLQGREDFETKSGLAQLMSDMLFVDTAIEAIHTGVALSDLENLEVILGLGDRALEVHSELMLFGRESDKARVDFLKRLQKEKDRADEYISKTESMVEDWKSVDHENSIDNFYTEGDLSQADSYRSIAKTLLEEIKAGAALDAPGIESALMAGELAEDIYVKLKAVLLKEIQREKDFAPTLPVEALEEIPELPPLELVDVTTIMPQLTSVDPCKRPIEFEDKYRQCMDTLSSDIEYNQLKLRELGELKESVPTLLGEQDSRQEAFQEKINEYQLEIDQYKLDLQQIRDDEAASASPFDEGQPEMTTSGLGLETKIEQREEAIRGLEVLIIELEAHVEGLEVSAEAIPGKQVEFAGVIAAHLLYLDSLANGFDDFRLNQATNSGERAAIQAEIDKEHAEKKEREDRLAKLKALLEGGASQEQIKSAFIFLSEEEQAIVDEHFGRQDRSAEDLKAFREKRQSIIDSVTTQACGLSNRGRCFPIFPGPMRECTVFAPEGYLEVWRERNEECQNLPGVDAGVVMTCCAYDDEFKPDATRTFPLDPEDNVGIDPKHYVLWAPHVMEEYAYDDLLVAEVPEQVQLSDYELVETPPGSGIFIATPIRDGAEDYRWDIQADGTFLSRILGEGLEPIEGLYSVERKSDGVLVASVVGALVLDDISSIYKLQSLPNENLILTGPGTPFDTNYMVERRVGGQLVATPLNPNVSIELGDYLWEMTASGVFSSQALTEGKDPIVGFYEVEIQSDETLLVTLPPVDDGGMGDAFGIQDLSDRIYDGQMLLRSKDNEAGELEVGGDISLLAAKYNVTAQADGSLLATPVDPNAGMGSKDYIWTKNGADFSSEALTPDAEAITGAYELLALSDGSIIATPLDDFATESASSTENLSTLLSTPVLQSAGENLLEIGGNIMTPADQYRVEMQPTGQLVATPIDPNANQNAGIDPDADLSATTTAPPVLQVDATGRVIAQVDPLNNQPVAQPGGRALDDNQIGEFFRNQLQQQTLAAISQDQADAAEQAAAAARAAEIAADMDPNGWSNAQGACLSGVLELQGENTVFDGPGLGCSPELTVKKVDPLISRHTNLPLLAIHWTQFFLGFAAVLAVIAVVWAGVLYLTSFINEANAETAKKILLWAVVGIILIIGAFALVNTLITANPL